MNIAIIYGGSSSERKCSEANAHAVCESLLRMNHAVEMIHYDKDMLRKLTDSPPELVFLCVQGKHHGDGTLQAILDFLGIPYTGSGAAAAALINDKILCKMVFDRYGRPTPDWFSLTKREYESGSADIGRIGYPFVAKAPTQGMSFGIALVKGSDTADNVYTAFEFDDPILCESFIDGKACTVGVLEEGEKLTALPCLEMQDKRIDRSDEFMLMYGDCSIELCTLESSVIEDMQNTAKAVFRETGAHDYARIDFMVDASTGAFYVLEINAVPGLKPEESFLPVAAHMAGIEYDELIERIILNAKRRYGLC